MAQKDEDRNSEQAVNRSTGQTEEETSDGRDERLAVAGDNDSQCDGRVLSGGNRDGIDSPSPLAPSVSAPDRIKPTLRYYGEEYVTTGQAMEYASSSSAAQDRILAELRDNLRQTTKLKDAALETHDELRDSRDRLQETNRELNRRNQALQHSLNLESGRKSWYGYFQAVMQLFKWEIAKVDRLREALKSANEQIILWEQRAIGDN